METTIEHDDDRILLVAEPGPDFGDTWQLPAGPVLPGQTLTDALRPAVAVIGLTIDEVTGYLGHHDYPGGQITRVSCLTVTVTGPEAICRHARTGHRWGEDQAARRNGPAATPVTVPAAAATGARSRSPAARP